VTGDERWYWLDWLRVLAMGMIFFFHNSRPFSIIPWHVMNPKPDLGFTLFDVFVSVWIMPLFFVVSGMAVYFSSVKRSAAQFARDRFLRLMVPFVAGLFLVIPVNVYYDVVFHGHYAGDFNHFYLGLYFTEFFPFTLSFSPTYFADSDQGVYLWYLFWLFIFSIVTIQLFKWFTGEKNHKRISKVASICNRRGGILLLTIPLIIVNVLAVPPFFIFPSGYGGWKLPAYLVFFITAYVMASDPRFGESIDKNRILTLFLGIVTSASIITLLALVGTGVFQHLALTC
jgi:glucan biosynthesis protein C